ncbi:MAG: zinc-binding dehydrogenase [Caldilineaceae bacterium]|nr:zinc-binding dehydrogenase [Caldilineaceae bacterium]
MKCIGIEFPELGAARLFDLPGPPQPGPTEIVTRTLFSGVTNGTERHTLMADFGSRFPARSGYQHVSVIEEVGQRVDQFSAGETVFLGNHGGHRGWHLVDLAAANPRERLCIELPPDLEHEFCALFGIAGVGFRHSRRIRVDAPMRVWVAGLGLIGQSVAQASRALGAHVTVTDLDPRRLEIATQLGAHRVIDINDDSAVESLSEGGPYDRIVDACGAPDLFDFIYEHKLLALYGAIGALAGRQPTVFHQTMLHALRASIESSSHFTLEDLGILRHYCQLDTVRIAPMVTHRVPVEEAPAIYATMRDEPSELLGVIFDWRT